MDAGCPRDCYVDVSLKEHLVNHSQAKAILESSDATIVLDDDAGTATINGSVSIEELQAILQLLEYSA